MLSRGILFSKISYLQPPGLVKIKDFPILQHEGEKKAKLAVTSSSMLVWTQTVFVKVAWGRKAIRPPLLSHFLLPH